ncbi:MAG: DUF3108 domain-containing protein [Verrucomicrobiota bacterium]
MKLSLALILLLAAPLQADWRKDLAPAKPGGHPKPDPMVLAYDLSWKGMVNAGSLTFSFGLPDPKHPGTYNVTVNGGSTGVASKLFPYKVYLNSNLDPSTLRPRSFKGVEIEGDEITTSTSTFTGNSVKNTERNRPDKKSPERKYDTEFKFGPTFDAASAILHVRSHPLKDGDTLKYAFVPINSPYLVTAKVLGREQHQGRPAIKLSINMRKINPKTFELLPYKKLKSATLWISDDADRIPLEIRSEVFIGDVRMTLKRMQKR